MCRAFAQQAAEEAVDVDVALAAGASFDIELEIGKPSGSFADVRKCGFGERSAAKICVQDDAGRIDHRKQRMSERLTKVLFDGGGEPVQGKSQCGLIQQSRRDFFPHTSEHSACGIGDCGGPVARGERSHAWHANQFIDRRQFAKKLRVRRAFHFWITHSHCANRIIPCASFHENDEMRGRSLDRS